MTVEWLEQAAPEVREQTGYNWMIRLPEDGTTPHDERLVGVPEFVARDLVALWQPGMPYDTHLSSPRRCPIHAESAQVDKSDEARLP